MLASEKDNRSAATLLSDLVGELSALMHQEVLLAKKEMTEKISQIGKGGASLAVGGVILFAGFLVLLTSAVVALAHTMPVWLSALLVGGVVTVVGGVLLMKGISNLKAENLAPKRTIDSLKRDKAFAQEHIGR